MTADVIVVGAGLAGASVAWHLAPHARVLLLEQGRSTGAEATAQNAGMVRVLGEDPVERALALRSAARFQAPGEDWEDAPPSRVTGAVLGLGHDPSHLHDGVAHLRAAGVRVEALDRPAEVAPLLRGSPLRAAWYLPDARLADPHALLSGFLRGARRHDAALRLGVEVRGLIRDGDRVVGVRTDREELRADRVVLAAGAWSARLAAGVGLRRPLIPLRRTLLQTAPHPDAAVDHPWCWIDDVGVYARPEAGGWLCSPCDEAVDAPGTGPGSRGPVEPEIGALLAHKLERWMPALRDLPLRAGWSGLRTFAPDRRPLMGEDPDADGLWWAAGLGGFGVTCSFAVGEAVAAWMRGSSVDWLRPRGVSPGRPFLRRWPIRPTGDLGASRLIEG